MIRRLLSELAGDAGDRRGLGPRLDATGKDR
jgi:hypothetical protein